MKIRLAIVSPNILKNVRDGVELLQQALKSGDMEGLDTATAAILASTENSQSVDISEGDWRMFLKGIRRRDPEFQSSYLLPGEIFAEIFPAIAADDYVLELPIDEEAEEGETYV